MMLTLLGLPPDLKKRQIQSLIEERCGVADFILLDNLRPSKCTRTQSVTLCCDDVDVDAVVARLHGVALGAYRLSTRPVLREMKASKFDISLSSEARKRFEIDDNVTHSPYRTSMDDGFSDIESCGPKQSYGEQKPRIEDDDATVLNDTEGSYVFERPLINKSETASKKRKTDEPQTSHQANKIPRKLGGYYSEISPSTSTGNISSDEFCQNIDRCRETVQNIDNRHCLDCSSSTDSNEKNEECTFVNCKKKSASLDNKDIQLRQGEKSSLSRADSWTEEDIKVNNLLDDLMNTEFEFDISGDITKQDPTCDTNKETVINYQNKEENKSPSPIEMMSNAKTKKPITSTPGVLRYDIPKILPQNSILSEVLKSLSKHKHSLHSNSQENRNSQKSEKLPPSINTEKQLSSPKSTPKEMNIRVFAEVPQEKCQMPQTVSTDNVNSHISQPIQEEDPQCNPIQIVPLKSISGRGPTNETDLEEELKQLITKESLHQMQHSIPPSTLQNEGLYKATSKTPLRKDFSQTLIYTGPLQTKSYVGPPHMMPNWEYSQTIMPQGARHAISTQITLHQTMSVQTGPPMPHMGPAQLTPQWGSHLSNPQVGPPQLIQPYTGSPLTLLPQDRNFMNKERNNMIILFNNVPSNQKQMRNFQNLWSELIALGNTCAQVAETEVNQEAIMNIIRNMNVIATTAAYCKNIPFTYNLAFSKPDNLQWVPVTRQDEVNTPVMMPVWNCLATLARAALLMYQGNQHILRILIEKMLNISIQFSMQKSQYDRSHQNFQFEEFQAMNQGTLPQGTPMQKTSIKRITPRFPSQDLIPIAAPSLGISCQDILPPGLSSEEVLPTGEQIKKRTSSQTDSLEEPDPKLPKRSQKLYSSRENYLLDRKIITPQLPHVNVMPQLTLTSEESSSSALTNKLQITLSPETLAALTVTSEMEIQSNLNSDAVSERNVNSDERTQSTLTMVDLSNVITAPVENPATDIHFEHSDEATVSTAGPCQTTMISEKCTEPSVTAPCPLESIVMESTDKDQKLSDSTIINETILDSKILASNPEVETIDTTVKNCAELDTVSLNTVSKQSKKVTKEYPMSKNECVGTLVCEILINSNQRVVLEAKHTRPYKVILCKLIAHVDSRLIALRKKDKGKSGKDLLQLYREKYDDKEDREFVECTIAELGIRLPLTRQGPVQPHGPIYENSAYRKAYKPTPIENQINFIGRDQRDRSWAACVLSLDVFNRHTRPYKELHNWEIRLVEHITNKVKVRLDIMLGRLFGLPLDEKIMLYRSIYKVADDKKLLIESIEELTKATSEWPPKWTYAAAILEKYDELQSFYVQEEARNVTDCSTYVVVSVVFDGGVWRLASSRSESAGNCKVLKVRLPCRHNLKKKDRFREFAVRNRKQSESEKDIPSSNQTEKTDEEVNNDMFLQPGKSYLDKSPQLVPDGDLLFVPQGRFPQPLLLRVGHKMTVDRCQSVLPELSPWQPTAADWRDEQPLSTIDLWKLECVCILACDIMFNCGEKLHDIQNQSLDYTRLLYRTMEIVDRRLVELLSYETPESSRNFVSMYRGKYGETTDRQVLEAAADELKIKLPLQYDGWRIKGQPKSIGSLKYKGPAEVYMNYVIKDRVDRMSAQDRLAVDIHGKWGSSSCKFPQKEKILMDQIIIKVKNRIDKMLGPIIGMQKNAIIWMYRQIYNQTEDKQYLSDIIKELNSVVTVYEGMYCNGVPTEQVEPSVSCSSGFTRKMSVTRGWILLVLDGVVWTEVASGEEGYAFRLKKCWLRYRKGSDTALGQQNNQISNKDKSMKQLNEAVKTKDQTGENITKSYGRELKEMSPSHGQNRPQKADFVTELPNNKENEGLEEVPLERNLYSLNMSNNAKTPQLVPDGDLLFVPHGRFPQPMLMRVGHKMTVNRCQSVLPELRAWQPTAADWRDEQPLSTIDLWKLECVCILACDIMFNCGEKLNDIQNQSLDYTRLLYRTMEIVDRRLVELLACETPESSRTFVSMYRGKYGETTDRQVLEAAADDLKIKLPLQNEGRRIKGQPRNIGLMKVESTAEVYMNYVIKDRVERFSAQRGLAIDIHGKWGPPSCKFRQKEKILMDQIIIKVKNRIDKMLGPIIGMHKYAIIWMYRQIYNQTEDKQYLSDIIKELNSVVTVYEGMYCNGVPTKQVERSVGRSSAFARQKSVMHGWVLLELDGAVWKEVASGEEGYAFRLDNCLLRYRKGSDTALGQQNKQISNKNKALKRLNETAKAKHHTGENITKNHGREFTEKLPSHWKNAAKNIDFREVSLEQNRFYMHMGNIAKTPQLVPDGDLLFVPHGRFPQPLLLRVGHKMTVDRCKSVLPELRAWQPTAADWSDEQPLSTIDLWKLECVCILACDIIFNVWGKLYYIQNQSLDYTRLLYRTMEIVDQRLVELLARGAPESSRTFISMYRGKYEETTDSQVLEMAADSSKIKLPLQDEGKYQYCSQPENLCFLEPESTAEVYMYCVINDRAARFAAQRQLAIDIVHNYSLPTNNYSQEVKVLLDQIIIKVKNRIDKMLGPILRMSKGAIIWMYRQIYKQTEDKQYLSVTIKELNSIVNVYGGMYCNGVPMEQVKPSEPLVGRGFKFARQKSVTRGWVLLELEGLVWTEVANGEEGYAFRLSDGRLINRKLHTHNSAPEIRIMKNLDDENLIKDKVTRENSTKEHSIELQERPPRLQGNLSQNLQLSHSNKCDFIIVGNGSVTKVTDNIGSETGNKDHEKTKERGETESCVSYELDKEQQESMCDTQQKKRKKIYPKNESKISNQQQNREYQETPMDWKDIEQIADSSENGGILTVQEPKNWMNERQNNVIDRNIQTERDGQVFVANNQRNNVRCSETIMDVDQPAENSKDGKRKCFEICEAIRNENKDDKIRQLNEPFEDGSSRTNISHEYSSLQSNEHLLDGPLHANAPSQNGSTQPNELSQHGPSLPSEPSHNRSTQPNEPSHDAPSQPNEVLDRLLQSNEPSQDGPSQPNEPPQDGPSQPNEPPQDGPSQLDEPPQDGPSQSNESPQGGPLQPNEPPQDGPSQPTEPPQGRPSQPNEPPQGRPSQTNEPPQDGPSQPNEPPQGRPSHLNEPPQGSPSQTNEPPQDGPSQPNEPPQGRPSQKNKPPQDGPSQPNETPQGRPSHLNEPPQGSPSQTNEPPQDGPSQPYEPSQGRPSQPNEPPQGRPSQTNEPPQDGTSQSNDSTQDGLSHSNEPPRDGPSQPNEPSQDRPSQTNESPQDGTSHSNDSSLYGPSPSNESPQDGLSQSNGPPQDGPSQPNEPPQDGPSQPNERNQDGNPPSMDSGSTRPLQSYKLFRGPLLTTAELVIVPNGGMLQPVMRRVGSTQVRDRSLPTFLSQIDEWKLECTCMLACDILYNSNQLILPVRFQSRLYMRIITRLMEIVDERLIALLPSKYPDNSRGFIEMYREYFDDDEELVDRTASVLNIALPLPNGGKFAFQEFPKRMYASTAPEVTLFYVINDCFNRSSAENIIALDIYNRCAVRYHRLQLEEQYLVDEVRLRVKARVDRMLGDLLGVMKSDILWMYREIYKRSDDRPFLRDITREVITYNGVYADGVPDETSKEVEDRSKLSDAPMNSAKKRSRRSIMVQLDGDVWREVKTATSNVYHFYLENRTGVVIRTAFKTSANGNQNAFASYHNQTVLQEATNKGINRKAIEKSNKKKYKQPIDTKDIKPDTEDDVGNDIGSLLADIVKAESIDDVLSVRQMEWSDTRAIKEIDDADVMIVEPEHVLIVVDD